MIRFTAPMASLHHRYLLLRLEHTGYGSSMNCVSKSALHLSGKCVAAVSLIGLELGFQVEHAIS